MATDPASSPTMDEPRSHFQKEYTSIINSFLRQVSFSIPTFAYNPQVKGQIEDHFKSLNLPSALLHKLPPVIDLSAAEAGSLFPYLTTTAQVAAGVYNVYITLIDDSASDLQEHLRSFIPRLLAGQPQSHSLLQGLVTWLNQDCRQVFGDFGGDMIVKTTLEFISMCYWEVQQEKNINGFFCPTHARAFPDYIRAKASGEAFAYQAFSKDTYPEERYLNMYLPAIPDLMRFIHISNDVISFYKEEMAGENVNLVHNQARVGMVTPLQSLKRLCDETVDLMRRIHLTLERDAKLQGDIDSMMMGFIFLQLGIPRYRLAELDIPMAKECQTELLSKMRVLQGSISESSI